MSQPRAVRLFTKLPLEETTNSSSMVTASGPFQCIVADLFEQQEKTIDESGRGDKKRFLKGIKTYGLKETDLHTAFTGSTNELPFDWSSYARFRLISVDASHTGELTFNDLQIAF